MRRLKELVEKYKKRLGLDDYCIDFKISKNDYICADKQGNVSVKKEYGYAEVMNRYIEAKDFSVVVDELALKKRDLDDTVAHELLHILLWSFTDIIDFLIPLCNLSEQGREYYTSELAKREHEVIEKLIPIILGDK